MGLPQEQCNLKTLPLNISYFIHLFQQGLEGWWNVASVQTAVIFSQKHCLYGIPASLQGGLKPYCTILQIISVCVLDPKREEMKHNNFVGCEGGGGGGGVKRSPVPQARLGGSDPGWVPALRDQIHTTVLRTHQWIAELHLLPFIFLQVKQRWYQLRGPLRWKSPSALQISSAVILTFHSIFKWVLFLYGQGIILLYPPLE